MTMLDDRARLAVDAIERSVADHTAAAGVSGAVGFAAVKRRHAMWAGAGWALAGSAAASRQAGNRAVLHRLSTGFAGSAK